MSEPCKKKQKLNNSEALFDTIGNLIKFKELVSSGQFDFAKLDQSGNTILHDVILRCKNKRVWSYLRVLSEHNMDINMKNNEKITALTLAMNQGWFLKAGYLVDLGAKTEEKSFKAAVVTGNLEKVKSYVDANYKLLKEEDYNNKLPIQWAIQAGRLNIVQYFAKDCGMIDMFTECSQEPTSLWSYALYYDQLSIVKWLHKVTGIIPRFQQAKGNCARWLLSFPNIIAGTDGVDILVTIRSMMDNNKHLDLSNCNVGDTACEFVAISILYKLEHQTRSILRLGPFLGVQHLIKTKNGPESIDLSDNPRITDKGVFLIAENIPKSLSLKTLTLPSVSVQSYNNLHDVSSNIQLNCKFPTLLTIAIHCVADYVKKK